VTAHFHEQGSVLAGTAEGRCQGFEVEISIDSDEEEQKIAELIRLAHQMCFTEDALTGQVQISRVHRLNGQPIEVKPQG
jgi:organic hydroperoxide reductase OsmC/OhrA